jgi:hypothetical protein
MDGEQFSAHCSHLDVELLEQLAARSVEIGLALFELATGELPQTAVSLLKRPSTDQKASVLLNDSGENAYNRVARQVSLAVELNS